MIIKKNSCIKITVISIIITFIVRSLVCSKFQINPETYASLRKLDFMDFVYLIISLVHFSVIPLIVHSMRGKRGDV